jgi:DNA excision repair protein ERCC-2
MAHYLDNAPPRESLVGDSVLDVLRTVLRLRDLLELDREELVAYVADDTHTQGPGVGLVCVDPAYHLSRCHQDAEGTVAMSATLSPLDYFREVLGFAHCEPVLVEMPSPFPPENRFVGIAPHVTTTYRHRHRHLADIARVLESTVAARAGRYAAFFPSFRFLEQVAAELAMPETTLLKQVPAMSSRQRHDLLDDLRSGPVPRLLLAVMGGIFAEGIDLPGESLVGAIVVGPGLPTVSFERALMKDYFDARTGQGFQYAMLYPGMQRVVQAAGRVIRGMHDQGVVLLLGSRFTRPEYSACLPRDWYADDPADLVCHDPSAGLRRFWRDQGQIAATPVGTGLDASMHSTDAPAS